MYIYIYTENTHNNSKEFMFLSASNVISQLLYILIGYRRRKAKVETYVQSLLTNTIYFFHKMNSTCQIILFHKKKSFYFDDSINIFKFVVAPQLNDQLINLRGKYEIKI